MSETPVIPTKQALITIGGEVFVAVVLLNEDSGLVLANCAPFGDCRPMIRCN
jgi:hypothetical protein